MTTHHRVPPPGQLHEINGLSWHVVRLGQGRPPVIFLPALGGFALQWTTVYETVAAATAIVAYDRAGQGWSDPATTARTPANLTTELRALLARLGQSPPYVLAAHSFGGLLARYYAGRYPDEVAGLVLVDTSHEDQYAPLPDFERVVRQTGWGVRALAAVSRLSPIGRRIARLGLGEHWADIPAARREQVLYAAGRPQHHRTLMAEFAEHRRYFGPQSEIPRALGDVPLTVISAGDSLRGSRSIQGISPEQSNANHQVLQAQLAGLSSRAQHITMPGATHLSILLSPVYAAQVADAIVTLVEEVRAG